MDYLVRGLRGLVRARAEGAFKERRRLVRIRCRYELSCAVGRRVDSVVLTELGLGGVRLEAPRRYRPGTVLELGFPPAPEYYEINTIRCQVAWCRRQRYRPVASIGARYCDSRENLNRSWARFLFQAMGLEERPLTQQRHYLRVSGKIPGSLMVDGGGGIVEGTVDDLSLGGALLRSVEGVRAGARGVFQLGPYAHLPQLNLTAEVVSLNRSSDQAAWLHGIRFQAEESRAIRILGRYLVTLLRGS